MSAPIEAKFTIHIRPDDHVGGGRRVGSRTDVQGWQVIALAVVARQNQAEELARWVQQALREKSAAHSSGGGLIIPVTIKDVPSGS